MMDHAHADKIREALILAKTERRHGETMEQALVRELAARGLEIVEIVPSPSGRGLG